MANGKSGYLLGSDYSEWGRKFGKTEKESYEQQGGINLSRGIGRTLGMFAGLALAGTGAGIPLLALAGGLGSLGGSLIGGKLGQQKYGDPKKAELGLFGRDFTREQHKGVDRYWKGVKEQVAVNTLQDAITAGMYGGQIQDFMSKGKFMLGGQPTGSGIIKSPWTGEVYSSTPSPIKQPNTAGIFPETSTRLKLPEVVHPPSAYPSAQTVMKKPPLQQAIPAIDFPASVATPELLGNVPLNQISGMQGYTPWEPLKEQYNPYGAFYNSIINKHIAPSSAGSAVMGNQYGGQQIMFE